MRDRADLTPGAGRAIVALRREIAGAGTRRDPQRRPTPLDEVRSGLIVFEQSLWDALPRYVRSRRSRAAATTGRGLPIDAAPLRFGSWIGGDRDGNPNVTPTSRGGLACYRDGWRPICICGTSTRSATSSRSRRPAAAPDALARRRRVSPIASCCATSGSDCWRRGDWPKRPSHPTTTPAPTPASYLDAADLLAHRCASATDRSSYRPGVIAARPADRPPPAGRSVRPHARAARHPAGLRPTHGGARRDHVARSGSGSYADWDEPTRIAFLIRALTRRRAASSREVRSRPTMSRTCSTRSA